VVSRLSTLFEFCRRRRWIQENPCAFVERVSIDRKAPPILTPEQARAALAAVPPVASAWFSLCLFAGVRPQESIGWDSIEWESSRIIVAPELSKVRRHRIVSPPDTLWPWLSLAATSRASLPISLATQRRSIRAVRDSLGWEAWPQDVLRHSAASYWLAVSGDVSRVAWQLGNSPAVLMRHYWNLVTPEEAERFWNLRPV
jgi:integrase